VQDLPTGEVTFLFTDIEGSTRLLEYLGEDVYGQVLSEHHRLIRDAVVMHGGVEVSTEGDAFFIAFQDAPAAAAAALAAQQALASHGWPRGAPVRVRMGLHTGRGRLGADNYVGLVVHEAARISAAAHGGQVIASLATVQSAPLLANGSSWRELGTHRLSDLSNQFELFQLCHSDLDDDLPPLRTLERVVHNLPLQQSAFLGRRRELAEGAGFLASTRMLSIVGPGGTGKTRVAYQLAAEQLDVFPDGIWVVELAPVLDPTFVTAVLLVALGLRAEPGRTAVETIVTHLRSRRTLVILDNCEHVIDDAAGLATALLMGCPDVKVLATSREPLRIPGEAVWLLPPLSLLAPDDSSSTLAQSDAELLFCQRASEARSDFVVDSTNAALIVDICARLEGVPLAIELAAARVRTLPLATISSRLSASLDILSKGSRGVSDRQSSLQATIQWSHDLLEDAERVLFRRTSTFVDGFTIDAAESVCAIDPLGPGDVVEALDGLVDKSLVSLVPASAGMGRYRLLETIRTYAAERASDAGEREVLAHQHQDYFAALATACAADPDTQGAMNQLAADHSNLLSALVGMREKGHGIEHGQLALDLSGYFELRGHWQLASRELRAYVDRPDADRALAGHCFLQLSRVTADLGNWDEARKHIQDALTIARELGDRALEAETLNELGGIEMKSGDFPASLARYEECLEVARAIGDRSRENRVLAAMSYVAAFTGQYIEARELQEQALAIAIELGDRRLQGTLSGNLGNVNSELGEYTTAGERYLVAIEIARELGDKHSEARWLGCSGSLAARRGWYREAVEIMKSALEMARELEAQALLGWCVGTLGELLVDLGEYTEAEQRIDEALSLALSVGDRVTQVWWIGVLGKLAVKRGDYSTAKGHYVETLAIARDIGDRRSEGQWLGGLGTVASRTGDVAHADQLLQEALQIAIEVGDPRLISECHQVLSDVSVQRRDLGDAVVHLSEALNVERTLDGDSSLVLESCIALLIDLGDHQGAGELLAIADRVATGTQLARPKWEQERYESAVVAYRAHRGASAATPPPEMHAVGRASAVDVAIEHLGRYSNAT
jgi:predicted ATPase/class 3 adenylate cyclase